MTDRIQIIKHEVVPKFGSYEARFPDGRPGCAGVARTIEKTPLV